MNTHKRVVVAFILGLVLLLALGQGNQTFGAPPDEKPQPPPTPEREKVVDSNKNKLFDNLERRMKGAAEGQPFGVIVVLNEELPEGVPALKGAIGDFQVEREFPSINGFSTTLTKGQIVAAAKQGAVRQVEHNGQVFAIMDTAKESFGVNKAVSDFGVTGDAAGNGLKNYAPTDIVIAIIDSGVDADHVDLGPGKILGGYDFVNDDTDPDDDNFHGTWVASIAAGEGDGNPIYRGVAPGAALVALKVLGKSGSGSFADVNAAIQWVIDNKNGTADTLGGAAPFAGVDIINMSLGCDCVTDGTFSTELLSDAAVDAGVVVVIAAGNAGPAEETVGIPAGARKPITVGAMADVGEDGFYLARFSSRGPTNDGRVKPDIAAAGVDLTGAKAKLRKNDPIDGYTTASGTSGASPFVAGVAALMLHANDSLTPGQVKSIIMDTATDWARVDGGGDIASDIDYGAGRLNAYEAVRVAPAVDLTGTGPALPSHFYRTADLSATGDQDVYTITLDSITEPLAVTMIMPTWQRTGMFSTAPDFDMELLDSEGNRVAISQGVRRQETISISASSLAAGDYTLRVYSYSGSGPYFFDLSVSTSVSPESFTPGDGAAPGTPMDVGVTMVSDSRLQVDWSANLDPDLQGYKVFRDGVLLLAVVAAPATSYLDIGLPAGTTFTYEIGAYDTSGNDSALSILESETTSGVAGTADALTSTITASPTTITADGVSTSSITVQLKDGNGNNLTSGGDTVTLSTDLGTIGAVTDEADGSYSATLTAGTTTGTATVSGTVNAVPITDTATVTLTPRTADALTSTITASPTTITADGASTSSITVQLKDGNGNNLTSGGDTVTLSTDLGTIGAITDEADGSYSATLTAGTATGTATVSGTVNAVSITDTATVTLTASAATGTITGRVTEGTEPIAGATVSFKGGFQATTDPNGNYTISDVPAGKYKVKARAKGYVSASQEVTVPEGGTVTADFSLTPR